MPHLRHVGLVGTNGSGKSTACTFFKDQGYTVVSLSDALRKYVISKHLPMDRDTLTNTANALKDERGADVLAQIVMENIDTASFPVAFDSIRNEAELLYLKKRGVFFIGITAPIDVRYQRVIKRKRETDAIDFDTFLRQDQRENEGQSKGQNIHLTLKKCDINCENSGSVAEFYDVLTAIVKEHL